MVFISNKNWKITVREEKEEREEKTETHQEAEVRN